MAMDGEMTSKEEYFYLYAASVLGNVLIAGGWYLFSNRFYETSSAQSQQRDASFFQQMSTPLIASESTTNSDDRDFQQRALLGNLCLVYGGCIMLMALIPNPIEGRKCFVFCGGVVAVTLWCLRAARK